MIPTRNTPERYGKVAVTLHWLIALLIICMLIVGYVMAGMENSPDKFKLIGLHKATGAVVLMLVALRLLWRATGTIPSLPSHMKAWEKLAAHGAHWGLYALMIAMPLSGWLMSSASGFPVSVYGFFTLPDLIEKSPEWRKFYREAHDLMAYALIGLASLHALAALKHHFIDKDNVLRGMLPWDSKTPSSE